MIWHGSKIATSITQKFKITNSLRKTTKGYLIAACDNIKYCDERYENQLPKRLEGVVLQGVVWDGLKSETPIAGYF